MYTTINDTWRISSMKTPIAYGGATVAIALQNIATTLKIPIFDSNQKYKETKKRRPYGNEAKSSSSY